MTTTTDTTTTETRVWVGCLACYNEGRLSGDWFDAENAEDVTIEVVHAAAGYHGGAGHEELWCMDHEGFDGILDGECSPMEASRLARVLDKCDEEGIPRAAFAAWVKHTGQQNLDTEHVDEARESYDGKHTDRFNWAWDRLESMGMLEGLPDWVDTHKSALVRSWLDDAELGGEVWFEETTDGLYAFMA